MPFVPKKQAFNAHINEVVLGVGDKATAIGGQNVLPFHTFDAEIKNAPKIGVELTDLGMAEYTMPGEKATTCIYGRDPKVNGNPVHMCEMLATLTGPAYIERVSCYDAAHVNKTKAALKKAFQIQMEKKGLSFIEIVANCPSNYHQTPLESMQFVKEKGCSFYPLGVFKDITKEEK